MLADKIIVIVCFFYLVIVLGSYVRIKIDNNLSITNIEKMNKKILIIGNSIENTIGANITIPITNNVHFNISIKSIASSFI